MVQVLARYGFCEVVRKDNDLFVQYGGNMGHGIDDVIYAFNQCANSIGWFGNAWEYYNEHFSWNENGFPDYHYVRTWYGVF